MQNIYLDNNATTAIDPRVNQAMQPFLTTQYGNPNSLHDYGREVHPAMLKALDQLYKGINAREDDDVVVNGCATEGNNTVLMSAYFSLIQPGLKKNIITSAVEHPSVTGVARFLESLGVELITVDPDSNGIITPEALLEVITPETALVSVMWANNETGLIMPIKELAEVAHTFGALFHTDAVQAIGKVPVDVQEVNVDFLTFSAHKFHGPKGIGALYMRQGVPYTPLLHGGEQMGGKRSGTVNVAFMVGMGLAMELAVQNLEFENTEVRRLRDKLEQAILQVPDTFIVGYDQLRTPNTTLVSFEGIEGEAFLWDLNHKTIAASTGSACSSEDLEANATFKAMNIAADLEHTGIRLSISRFTTDADIDSVIAAIEATVMRLREISSVYSSAH